jgi:hypothetical protein
MEIQLNKNTYLFIEVPDDAYDFHYDSWFTRYINHSKGSIKLDVNTEIISTTKDITEEQAGSIVEFDEINGEHPDFVNGVAWLNYKRNRYEYNRVFRAKESLQSLIQANGLDVNKNYLILKKS